MSGRRLTAALATAAMAVALAAGLALGGCSTPYRGPVSPHFDGSRFFNPGQDKQSSVAGYLWLRLTTPRGAWPDAVPAVAHPPPPAAVDGGQARITMVGHATLLIQVAGLNLLTDPVWSDRASPFGFLGPKRVSPPGIAFDALPRIDAVLLSHDHYDHLDLQTLERLDARDRPRVLVPLGNRKRVSEAMPASIVSEHDWGERVALPRGVTVDVEPMVHGSGRSPFDQQATLWAAYVVKANGLSVLFVGDSGYGDGSVWRDMTRKHSGFDLAILPIGAYAPQSFMGDSHMTPAEAVRVKVETASRRALAHHFDVFRLGFEAHGDAPSALRDAAKAAGLAGDAFMLLQPGEAMTLGARERSLPRADSPR